MREKSPAHFFASMAHYVPELTSQVVSRPLRFTLTPPEKSARLGDAIEAKRTFIDDAEHSEHPTLISPFFWGNSTRQL
jgi:hypothetical protein